MRLGGISFVILLAVASAARGENPAPESTGAVIRGGVGGSFGSAIVLDESNGEAGVVLNAAIGYSGKKVGFELDITGQFYQVDNPLGGEWFRAAYVLPSIRVHGRHAYGSLGFGATFYSFAGPLANEASDIGPALGLTVGYETRVRSRLPIAVEAFLRGGITSDFELTSTLVGARVVISHYF